MIEFFSDPMIFSFSFIITYVLSFHFVLDGFLICNFIVTTFPYTWVRCHGKMFAVCLEGLDGAWPQSPIEYIQLIVFSNTIVP